MNNRLTAKERAHLAKVKALPCSVCDAPAPSEAHHFKQHRQYTTIALCQSCHTGDLNGIHKQKRMWAIKKMEEIDALDVTISRLMNG